MEMSERRCPAQRRNWINASRSDSWARSKMLRRRNWEAFPEILRAKPPLQRMWVYIRAQNPGSYVAREVGMPGSFRCGECELQKSVKLAKKCQKAKAWNLHFCIFGSGSTRSAQAGFAFFWQSSFFRFVSSVRLTFFRYPAQLSGTWVVSLGFLFVA